VEAGRRQAIIISDLRKVKYFCAEDWTAQTGIEFPQEIRFSAQRIFELSSTRDPKNRTPICPCQANLALAQSGHQPADNRR
jgi:hypothetical protein